ncbi:hypothetical protein TWF225_004252 [Orbilia oligospora]|nr:hypothetical protein TWF225_004252 [Orbilia oligospora]KAF3245123.1 hypothetical protein TWF128_009518 [Orbilia oligospora]KAF3272846.1 hypothetical protein TWF217_000306 [Orbilia oligospora]KAF3277863.1 hypothetical protein TWF132_001329 [Orbilia oligospora]
MSTYRRVSSSAKLKPARMAIALTALPIETLLHITGYLSNDDVAAFTRVLPYLSPLVSRKSFRRWQRLVEDFTYRLHDTFDSIENDRRQRNDIPVPVNATALKAEPSKAAAFEDVYLPKILAEMGIILQERQLIQLDDIFLSLRELGNGAGTAFSPLVDCPDPEESSRILRSALNNILPIDLVKSLLPSTISENTDSIPFATFDLILLTGYLLFAELQPKDIITLRPRYSTQGYISEQALVEYLSYILLFLRIFGLIQACAQDIVRSTKNGTTDRVQWKFTDGSPLSGQALQILERRIESWFADFYEVQTYSVSGSQKLPLTREQQIFVDSDIRKGEVFKVRAYAGTGKTKCLVDYAKKRPHKKILYVAYNKMAKLDADLRFKECYKVDCKTLHSVAFNSLSFVNPAVDLQVKGKTVGEPQASSRRGKFARIQSAPTENEFLQNWDIDAIVEALGLTLETVAPVFTTKFDWRDGSSGWSFNNGKPTVGTADNHRNPESLARVITSGIDRFCNSRDPKPTIAHLSLGQCRTRLCNPELATTWLKFLWKIIVSGKSPLMTHDCYLKMFSLTSNPDADQATFGKYDIVMFDEAQDANPCMENIIQRQRDAAGIIIIGDPYQMIYGFRGAKNECFDDERLPPTRTFHLTKSFRFGKEIADVANLILGSVGETKLVRGGNASGPSPAVFLPPVLGYKDIAPAGQHTVIFRTNTELIKYFFFSFSKNPNKTICLRTSAANASTTIIPLLRAGYFLYKGKPQKHHRLRGVTSFEEAKAYVQREENSESPESDEVDIPALTLVVGMEEFYRAENGIDGTPFLEMLESSAQRIVNTEKLADIILTNAHQSKGLEWDDVIIAEDFVHGLEGLHSQIKSTEATNLLYVACTRARNRLQLSQRLAAFLVRRLGTFRFFVSPNDNSKCNCCRGKHPFNTFLSDDLTAGDAFNGTDTSNYLSSTPSPCIGYEAIFPRRDPSALNGWIDRNSQPLNPAEIPKCVHLSVISCVNCILSWRSLTNKTHGDLFRFAEGIKGRIGFGKHMYHGDYHIFWAGRFYPDMSSELPRSENRTLESAYHPKMRMGLQAPLNIGSVNESLVSWSDFVFGKARDSGAEYDDDDVDDFIKSFV